MRNRAWWYPPLVGIFVWILHVMWRTSLISFIPFVITWPIIVSWTYPRPLWWLIGFSQLAELFSTTPPGLITLVFLFPYFLRQWLFPSTEVAFSWRFFHVLMVSVGGMLSMILLPGIIYDGFFSQPWFLWCTIMVFTLLLTFGISVMWREIVSLPYERSSSRI